MAPKRKPAQKKTQVKTDKLDDKRVTLASKLPVLPKSTQATITDDFDNEDSLHDIYDEIDSLIGHVDSISGIDQMTVYVDGVDHLRRHDRTLPNNHLVKRNPYHFLWPKLKNVVGNKAKEYSLVTRDLWKMLQDRYNVSVKADHSPDENYIQNGENVLAVIKWDNWDNLHQKDSLKSAIAAKTFQTTRTERSRRAAEAAEVHGDMSLTNEMFEQDRQERNALQAESEHVSGGFTEDLSSVMKRLESGQTLSPDEMESALKQTSVATREIIIPNT